MATGTPSVRWLGRTAVAMVLAVGAARSTLAQELPGSSRTTRLAAAAIYGTVTDSGSGQPLISADVQLVREGHVLVATTTSALGRYALRGLERGGYSLEVRRLGFRPAAQRLVLADGDTTIDVVLVPAALTLDSITVMALSPVAVDARTGNQVFQQETYHGSPATTTSQTVQQALAGAARAPTGEVHIRGQHDEFTYYVDGIPIPPGISGSLSEVFSPAILDRMEFQTGGWDAEYGNRNTAVMHVDTRIPVGGAGVQGSLDAGSFGAAGLSLLASGNVGRLGVVSSVAQRVTDMWREPVMQAAGTGAPINFHNTGSDRYGFGKLQYAAGTRDFITLDLSVSATQFEVPFDSTGGIRLDDRQHESNGFATLAWHHASGARPTDGELFVGVYHRESALRYTPGVGEPPQFTFYPDTTQYNVSEDRTASTTGIKLDALLPSAGPLQVKTGFDASLVGAHEHFASLDAQGAAGPSVDAPVHGGDVGLYLQGSFQPSPFWELRPGLRYDVHTAPLAGSATQLSPRLRLNLFPSARTSLWLYYGRLFVPSPVEDFHVLASAGQGGQAGQPTYPERDHFFEVGLVHRWPGAGMSLKLDAYHKESTPGVDDNTLPGTAVTADVNVAKIRITGLESVLAVRPDGPLSGYLNVALSHASAHGPITGGFSPTAYPTGWYDLDHDQRLSIVGNLSYERRRWYAGATGIFGSGLTNGHPSAAVNGTGLFDLNAAVKVPPSFIVNASAGSTVRVLGRALRPAVFVDNLFNLHYVLKGAFTSGPSIGRPRTLLLRLDVDR